MKNISAPINDSAPNPNTPIELMIISNGKDFRRLSTEERQAFATDFFDSKANKKVNRRDGRPKDKERADLCVAVYQHLHKKEVCQSSHRYYEKIKNTKTHTTKKIPAKEVAKENLSPIPENVVRFFNAFKNCIAAASINNKIKFYFVQLILDKYLSCKPEEIDAKISVDFMDAICITGKKFVLHDNNKLTNLIIPLIHIEDFKTVISEMYGFNVVKDAVMKKMQLDKEKLKQIKQEQWRKRIMAKALVK